MPDSISYENFIILLNQFKIKNFEFSILGYPHYKRCLIQTKRDVLKNGNVVPLISVYLTIDGKVDVSFYKKFDEKYKLFNMKKGRTYTLKQIWNVINIHKIEYYE